MSKPKLSAGLKRWRKLKGLTQKAAAKRLGLSYRTFQNWELEVRIPSAVAQEAVMARLADQR